MSPRTTGRPADRAADAILDLDRRLRALERPAGNIRRTAPSGAYVEVGVFGAVAGVRVVNAAGTIVHDLTA